jgi:ribose-phosphate pyrophosphokinase
LDPASEVRILPPQPVLASKVESRPRRATSGEGKLVPDELKIFSGTSNPGLSQEICEYLEVPLGAAYVDRFTDGEIRIKVNENVRGTDVFVVQSTHPPADNILELLLMVDAICRASARRITAVVPYFGYARQDRKDQPRVPISAKLISNLLVTSGADRILTMDLHVEQIMGFFDIPVDQLYASPVVFEYFRAKHLEDFVIVSPDPGSVGRSRAFAKRLGDLPLVVIDKRRPAPDMTEVLNIIGEVRGKKVVIVDDILSTGRTMFDAAAALRKVGATEIYGACTHALFAGRSLELLEKSVMEKIVVTNTIPIAARLDSPKIEVLSVAPLLGEAITRIHGEQSISSLFE